MIFFNLHICKHVIINIGDIYVAIFLIKFYVE